MITGIHSKCPAAAGHLFCLQLRQMIRSQIRTIVTPSLEVCYGFLKLCRHSIHVIGIIGNLIDIIGNNRK